MKTRGTERKQSSGFCSAKTHDPYKSPERELGEASRRSQNSTLRTSRRGRKRLTSQQRYQVIPRRAGVGRPGSPLTSLAARREKLLCWWEAVTLGAIDAFLLLPRVGSGPWQRPLCPPGPLSLRYHGTRTKTRPQMSSLPRCFIHLFTFFSPAAPLHKHSLATARGNGGAYLRGKRVAQTAGGIIRTG